MAALATQIDWGMEIPHVSLISILLMQWLGHNYGFCDIANHFRMFATSA